MMLRQRVSDGNVMRIIGYGKTRNNTTCCAPLKLSDVIILQKRGVLQPSHSVVSRVMALSHHLGADKLPHWRTVEPDNVKSEDWLCE